MYGCIKYSKVENTCQEVRFTLLQVTDKLQYRRLQRMSILTGKGPRSARLSAAGLVISGDIEGPPL